MEVLCTPIALFICGWGLLENGEEESSLLYADFVILGCGSEIGYVALDN
jgi:hypothetical protein